MSMKLEINYEIITEGIEKRIEYGTEHNCYEVILEGYQLFPLEVENVNVKRGCNAGTFGVAEVKELNWKNGKTKIIYKLKKLNGVN